MLTSFEMFVRFFDIRNLKVIGDVTVKKTIILFIVLVFVLEELYFARWCSFFLPLSTEFDLHICIVVVSAVYSERQRRVTRE